MQRSKFNEPQDSVVPMSYNLPSSLENLTLRFDEAFRDGPKPESLRFQNGRRDVLDSLFEIATTKSAVIPTLKSDKFTVPINCFIGGYAKYRFST